MDARVAPPTLWRFYFSPPPTTKPEAASAPLCLPQVRLIPPCNHLRGHCSPLTMAGGSVDASKETLIFARNIARIQHLPQRSLFASSAAEGLNRPNLRTLRCTHTHTHTHTHTQAARSQRSGACYGLVATETSTRERGPKPKP